MGKFPEMHEKTSCLVCKRMANSRQGRGHPATRHPATRPPGHPATRPPGHPATRPPGHRPPATATGHPDTRTPQHPATNDTPDHRPRPAGHPASRLSQPPGRPRRRPRPRPGHGHGHARKRAILHDLEDLREKQLLLSLQSTISAASADFFRMSTFAFLHELLWGWLIYVHKYLT